MNKAIKTALILILTASVLTIVILIGKINSTLPKNPPEYSGNTAGNLYNHGLFVEGTDKIYFANVADSFRLYEMDLSLGNVRRLLKDSVEYLNLDAGGENLYYSRINYRKSTTSGAALDLQTSGIYRYSAKHDSLNRLFSNPCGTVLLAGNELLFQKHGSDGSFDVCSLSCTQKNAKPKLLDTSYFTPVNYFNNALYYAGVSGDHNLYAYRPDTNATQTIAVLNCYMPVSGRDGTYFLSMDHDYSLFLLSHNDDRATGISDRRICTYNLSPDENILYYQTDEKTKSALYRYDIYAKTEKCLMEGDFKNLNTVGKYLFFTDFMETVCYCYNSSDESLQVFAPEPSDE